MGPRKPLSPGHLRSRSPFPWLAAALVAASATACGPPPSAGVAPSPSPTASSVALGLESTVATTASAAPHILPPDVDLQITLSPEPSPIPLVRVKIGARPDSSPFTVWQASTALQLVGRVEATDDEGAFRNITVDSSTGATRFTLDRPTSGTTWLSYTVAGALPAYPDPPPIAVDPDRFEGAGEALIVVPAQLEDRPVRTVVRIETDEIGTREYVGAASSFGHGHRIETTARGADLRAGFYVAGLMGQASFRAPEGNDDAAWLGYTAFDPRPVFADMASLRTALKLLFRAPDAEKVTFLFVTDSRSEGDFVVSRRPRSVLARVGLQERWTPPLRITVAASVVHGWIGSRLWVGPTSSEREAESFWFTEGVSRHLARELLFRYGLIAPSDAAEEAEGLASVIATSPLTHLSNEELAKKPKASVPLLVARGALYALRVDAMIREKSKGKRTLDNVLSELYAAAAKVSGPLPTSAWVEAIAKDIGESERGVFRDAIELGKPFEMPVAALGPCFRRVTKTYVGFDIGFDEDATRKSKPWKLTGLVKGSPAEKAGLREGDEVDSIRAGRRAATTPVAVVVKRGEDWKTFTYLPAGKKVKGIGFERKKDVGDDACVPAP